MIFCIVFLDHYVDLTDWGLVGLASEMHAKEKYSLKSKGNHNIFCPFHNQLADFRSSVYRLQVTVASVYMY